MYDRVLVNLLSGLLHLREEEAKLLREYLESLKPVELRAEDLAGLAWTSYTTKQPAGPEEAAWIFARDRDGNIDPRVEPLLRAINQSETGRVSVGGFEYRLSGDGRFIQRRPLG